MRFRFIDEAAPGTIWAAIVLSLMSVGFAGVGIVASTILGVISGTVTRGIVQTNSLIPSPVLDERPVVLALVIGFVTAAVVGGVLVLSAVWLGKRRRRGLYGLTAACCVLVLGNLSFGLMVGNLPMVLCAVATVCGWLPTSRHFLANVNDPGVSRPDGGHAYE